MRAGRQEYAFLRGDERTPSKPARGRVAIHWRSAEALVAEERVEVGGDARKPLPHPREQFRIVRFGRHVHREVRARALGAGVTPDRGMSPHERAASNDGFNQTALYSLDVAP